MRTIKLNSKGTGRYDDVSPFIVTDKKLELQIELPSFNGEFYFVYEINGKTDKRLLFRSGQIVLDNLSAGEFKAAVKHYFKGELIKTYTVEPLLLKEVDEILSALPEIEELRRSIAAVERAFVEYKQTVADREKEREEALETGIKFIEANLLALKRFAYKDYQNNVYLGGGTKEDFIKEFGFPEDNKGEKENDED